MVGVDESPRGVPRRAYVNEFNVLISGKGRINCVWAKRELRPGGGIEWDSDNAKIVDVRRDGVHPICGWAGEDLGFPWCAEAAKQCVNTFVRADANEEVCGR